VVDNNLLSQTVFDILKQVLAGFKADAEADSGIWYRHLGALLRSEETEDGRGEVVSSRGTITLMTLTS